MQNRNPLVALATGIESALPTKKKPLALAAAQAALRCAGHQRATADAVAAARAVLGTVPRAAREAIVVAVEPAAARHVQRRTRSKEAAVDPLTVRYPARRELVWPFPWPPSYDVSRAGLEGSSAPTPPAPAPTGSDAVGRAQRAQQIADICRDELQRIGRDDVHYRRTLTEIRTAANELLRLPHPDRIVALIARFEDEVAPVLRDLESQREAFALMLELKGE